MNKFAILAALAGLTRPSGHERPTKLQRKAHPSLDKILSNPTYEPPTTEPTVPKRVIRKKKDRKTLLAKFHKSLKLQRTQENRNNRYAKSHPSESQERERASRLVRITNNRVIHHHLPKEDAFAFLASHRIYPQ